MTELNNNSIVVLSLENLEQFKKELLEELRNSIGSLSNGSKDELLTSQQVKDKYSIAASTLWRWERDKILTPKRIGRKVFYLESDIINACA